VSCVPQSFGKAGETNHAKREGHEEFVDSDLKGAPRGALNDILPAVSFGGGDDLIEALISGQRIPAWIEGEIAIGRSYPGPVAAIQFSGSGLFSAINS
jgi:hypothetical protein